MKGIMKVASGTGALIGGTLGALSGIKKREGETNKDRAMRMARRGAAGASVGYFSPAVYGNIKDGLKLRKSNTHVPYKGSHGYVEMPSLGGVIGGSVGSALGAASEAVKKNEGETKKEKLKRVAKGGAKGGLKGGVLGASIGAATEHSGRFAGQRGLQLHELKR